MEQTIVLDDPREQAVVDKLTELGRRFLKNGYYMRLIMTDDISSVKEIHTRAKETKNEFFYGLALPNDMQAAVDDIVRKDKKPMMSLIDKGQEVLDAVGLSVEFDSVQKAYLVTIKSCGMGFYISRKVHTPRHKRQKRITLNKLDKALAVGRNGQGGRRKIVLGRDAVV